MEIKISEYKKVVFAKPQKPGEQGGGKSQQVPPDVQMYNPFGDEDKDGEEKEGQDGKSEKGKDGKEGEGKDSEGKDGQEGDGKDGKGKKGEEGKDGEGEGEEGAEGKGKSGKGGKGGKGGGDPDSLTQEQLEKEAQELLEVLNKSNNLPTTPCGGNKKRNDKNQSDDPIERDKQEQEAAIARKQIEEILQKAAEEGHTHIFRPASRGTGGKGVEGAPKGDIVPIKMRKPEFLKKIKDFASKEFEKEYYKKGTDWFYTQAYGDILFKDKPKISVPQKFLYLMVDVSGSMFWGSGFDGKSLLEHLIGYLPVIAEDFKGQVWWISDGLITFADGSPGITLLSDYKGMSAADQSAYFKKVQNAKGSGGGTTFGVELQAIQDLREGKIDPLVKKALGKKLNIVIGKASKHMAAIIMLTDSEIDDAHIKYNWKGTDIVGGLPPSTVVMTDTHGCEYIKDMYPEDFKNKELRIECYDVTEGGKFKAAN